jgi:murein DD-endopeptidase MepM/ murein hydrolase activator NlpD
VPGEVRRGFDAGAHPFASGAHRGVDLDARPGDRVSATCAGPVTFAGAVGGSRVVTIACGAWRVTHLPLGDLAVAPGQAVRPGQPLGTVGAGDDHAGLHVGVRRAARRFGYVDPWPLFHRGAASDPIPVAGPPSRPRGRPAARRRPGTAPRAPRSPLRAVRVLRPSRPVARRPVDAPLASPLAWAGLAVLLGGVVSLRPRRRAVPIRLRAKEPLTRTR